MGRPLPFSILMTKTTLTCDLWTVTYNDNPSDLVCTSQTSPRLFNPVHIRMKQSTMNSTIISLQTWLTYLLTPWCRVPPEQLPGLQLVKKFPAFHGTPRFITALTSVRHLSLSWASPIQSIYPHPNTCRSVLILSTHLRLGLPSRQHYNLLTYLLNYSLHGVESFLRS
jgi:hypothetical protein